jgi:hypothetical protein
VSPELRWIRGAARRPRYVGFGQSWSLYRWINDLQGSRSLVERLALPSVGRLGRSLPVSDPTIREAWDRLTRAFPDITSALLVHTGFYKDTVLSGVITSPHRLFIKVFAGMADQEAEANRLHNLREIVPSGVVLAVVELEESGLVAYQLLERNFRRAPQSMLDDVAVNLGMNSYRHAMLTRGSSDDSWKAIIPNTRELLAKFGIDISDEIASTLSALAPIRPIAHGDFTPWNAFLSKEDRVAVVDYERVGPRAPFTDAWHLTTQPLALRGKTVLPTVLLARVRDAAECDDASVLAWFSAYILEELNQDASDWVLHGRHHPQLRRLILAKHRLLKDALSRIDLE